MPEWTARDFSRRRYTIEGEDLDKARSIRTIIQIDGKILVNIQLREPGIVAVISRPDEQGLDIEIIEAGSEPGMAPRYVDYKLPTGQMLEEPKAWQKEELHLK